MKTILPVAVASAIALSASAQAMHETSRVRRGDLIVMGVVKDRSSENLDEWGLNSLFTADLRITKVIRGRAPSRTLTIRYVAHHGVPADQKLRFHLRRSSTATWLVCKRRGGLGYICK